MLNPVTVAFTEEARTVAQANAAGIGVELEILYAGTGPEIDEAFAEIARRRCDALLVSPTPFFTNRRVQLVTLAIRDGAIALGTWQGVYFAELDGPRERSATITVIGD